MKRISNILIPVLAIGISLQQSCKNKDNIAGSDTGNHFPKQIIETISVEQAKALIDSLADHPDFMIMDVRSPDEYQGGHLQNAVNINFRDSRFDALIDQLDKSNTYLIYCASGSRSSQALEIMKDAGFLSVYNLAGGISAWRNTGYPVVT